jgi:hypothetical protein
VEIFWSGLVSCLAAWNLKGALLIRYQESLFYLKSGLGFVLVLVWLTSIIRSQSEGCRFCGLLFLFFLGGRPRLGGVCFVFFFFFVLRLYSESLFCSSFLSVSIRFF